MPSGKDPIPPLPTRAELDASDKKFLTQGAPFKADVTLVDLGEGPMVVKDFAGRAWWRRLIGRFEVDRECGAYSYVGPMPWFPTFIGRIDRDALAVEKVEGITLRLADDIDEKREDYLGQLRTAMERLTEIGFLHLDAAPTEMCCGDPMVAWSSSISRALSGSPLEKSGTACSAVSSSSTTKPTSLNGRPCLRPVATPERAMRSHRGTCTGLSTFGERGRGSGPAHPPSDQYPVSSIQTHPPPRALWLTSRHSFDTTGH
jgi:hypothetical protein